VVQYAQNSTVNRKQSDFGVNSDSIYKVRTPMMIEGEIPENKLGDESYFELARETESDVPNSLITPMTFMNVSSAKTPELVIRHDKSPAEKAELGAEQHVRDVILLVEDNAINMRVGIPLSVPPPTR
jgi:hypothetical protein